MELSGWFRFPKVRLTPRRNGCRDPAMKKRPPYLETFTERLRERAAVDLLAAATEITRLRALLDTVQRRSHTATPGNVVVELGGIREAEAYLDRVNAALTGQPQSGWRPIETAPHEEVVLLGWWQSDWLGNDDWVSEVDHASFGWRRGSISSRSYHGRATHWQPLPPPPQKENET